MDLLVLLFIFTIKEIRKLAFTSFLLFMFTINNKKPALKRWFKKIYQLACLIPGNSPFRAASLNAILESPIKR